MEEMARAVWASDDFADQVPAAVRAAAAPGSTQHLFNGEYYEHEIRPPKRTSRDPRGPARGHGRRRPAQIPDLQLGAGCLVDQLVGQYMAHVCGLGYLLDPRNVRTDAAAAS